MNKNDSCCKTIRSVAHLDIQYAHRFYDSRARRSTCTGTPAG